MTSTCARRSPWGSTASASSTRSTRKARKWRRTSPRAPSPTAASATRGMTSTPAAAKAAAGGRRLPGRLLDEAVLPRRRPRLPAGSRPGGRGNPVAAQAEPEHRRRDRGDGVGRLHRRLRPTGGSTGCTCWAGAPTTRTSPTSSTTTSREANVQFGTPFPEIFDLLVQGGQIADPAAAEPVYVQANNAIRELVPMVPVAHGGSAAAYLATVTEPAGQPADRGALCPERLGQGHVRLHAERRADQPVLRR